MSNLIYSMGVSLDGFIAGPGGEIAVPPPDEELHRFHNEQARELGAHLCGRRMYEVLSYWDTFADENPSAPEHELDFAEIWRRTPKLVFSTTLEEVGDNATLVTGDLADGVTALKEQTEGDLAVGGAGLASSLIALGLIDEYRPFIHPVVVGGGTAYLPPAVRLELRLLEARSFGSGTVYLRYERAAAGS
jgi:dihydrofolate reductase